MGRVHEALKRADQDISDHTQDTDSESYDSDSKTISIVDSQTTDEIQPDDTDASPVLSETTDGAESDGKEIASVETDNSSLSPIETTPQLLKTEPAKFPEPFTPPLFTPKPSFEYQAIKTKIITRFPDTAIKTIMVTGTSRQCGASTTSVGFATTLASDCKSRVLLIEANTRIPSFNKFFSLKEGLGLTDLFSDSSEELLPLQTAVTNNLFVIPAGERRPGVNTFFESLRFDGILEELRNAFDYVILDAPPVVSHDEPKVIGKKVDGVILVSRSGKSRQRVAIRAKDELEATGANILGVVLNRRKHYIPEWLYKRL